MWVNINEPVIDGEYHSISHQFAMAMRKEGWKLNDEIIWIKRNANFTQAKRTVRSHEYIFHFVKSTKYHYDLSWMSGLKDSQNLISFGTSGKVSNVISSMDFRDSIIRTNGNNMSELRKDCKKQGFNLTHSAGYPISIPLIAILTTSKVGDTILDIYSGTATTGEAALATNRKYIGYEIKPEFIMGSVVRLQDYTTDKVSAAA
jgi:DNA modification methylase